MEPVTRRKFLVTGSVGAAGAATAFGTGWALSSGSGESALSDDEIDEIDGPLVAQVTDPAKGELELLVGEREVVVTDKALVAKLLRATKS
jgi:hypothetical protein